MTLLQVIIILFALFAMSRAFLRFKDTKLSLGEFCFWMLIWVVVVIGVLQPSIVTPLSSFLGIGRGVDLVVYISVVLLFYLLFRVYVRITSMERSITQLVRSQAINTVKKRRP